MIHVLLLDLDLIRFYCYCMCHNWSNKMQLASNQSLSLKYIQMYREYTLYGIYIGLKTIGQYLSLVGAPQEFLEKVKEQKIKGQAESFQ